MSVDALTKAVVALRAAGAAAGLDEAAVDEEAAAFVATIAENAPRAATGWSTAFALPAATFGSAADRGRPWRDRPTTLLASLVDRSSERARAYAAALADLAGAAYGLGAESLSVLGVAGVAAAAQLRVVGGPSPSPTAGARPAVPAEVSTDAPPSATTVPADAAATAPLPTLAELLAQLDDLVGLEKVKTEVHRQAELLRIDATRSEKG